MKIVVTGAKGFIGKNLIRRFDYMDDVAVCEYDVDTDPAMLKEYIKDCDVVYHLAGVNRPEKSEEYMEGNFGFTKTLLDKMEEAGNKKAVFVMSSSIQATLDNPYGISKKAGEDFVREHSERLGMKSVIYRFPNVFGKWCRPNYNSAVATFCHNIARSMEIKVNDPEVLLHLVYIDDVVDELLLCLTGDEHVKDGFGYVPEVYDVKLGRIPELLYSFAETRRNLSLPDFSDPFEKKLYSTYLSYLPEDDLSYPLVMHEDSRGSFTEILKTDDRGQVSVNISHPGIVKGNHWHNTKNEKFLVVSGQGLIRLRKVGSDKIVEYRVSGDKLTVVDIPCGYTHSIANVGKDDMATVMWVNEVFDPENGDTFHEEV
ncbi:MAG: NAD-dependent epimerase/dehydratase family protein [Lachnospiraceae bacterium]|nr:NAD-dependent epimerase/dehydratase family protein [Lachnospiraceae bacterium]